MPTDITSSTPPYQPEYHQYILFGPPGTSKSYKANHKIAKEILNADVFPTTFHPDYSHGEFVARLLPITNEKAAINYEIHAGPFVRALAAAYCSPQRNVVLLIDEINRGNCAEIFGDVFQLLDRTEDGVSEYEIAISRVVRLALQGQIERIIYSQAKKENPNDDDDDAIKLAVKLKAKVPLSMLDEDRIKLPGNLYLIGTMNTSDESVYFMDSAFKRRWNFRYSGIRESLRGFKGLIRENSLRVNIQNTEFEWTEFVERLNNFILKECTSPKLDDKLVGPWFIKPQPYKGSDIFTAITGSLQPFTTRVAQSNGGQASDEFDQLVMNLVKNSHYLITHEVHNKIKQRLEYDINARRKFAKINSGTLNSDWPFYKNNDDDPKISIKAAIEIIISEISSTVKGVRPAPIPSEGIKGKLMLYLWDNVFSRDKTPLVQLLGVAKLKTFGEFADNYENFLKKVMSYPKQEDTCTAPERSGPNLGEIQGRDGASPVSADNPHAGKDISDQSQQIQASGQQARPAQKGPSPMSPIAAGSATKRNQR